MARKRRRKRNRLKTLFLLVFTPLVVWFFAFLLWLYWDDVAKLSITDKERMKSLPKGARNVQKTEPGRSEEKILDEDRRKLEEILNRGK